MEAIILSLHERWWRKMVSGEKVLEIRKTYPKTLQPPFRVLVYVTGGVGVCGEFNCTGIHKIRTLPEPQRSCGHAGQYNTQKASCLTEEQLKAYAGENGKALWGWSVSSAKEYTRPIPLELYGIFRAPQSWQYFKGQEPEMTCAVCGKAVDKVEPCPYNRYGRPVCGKCCKHCLETEPFPCADGEKRKRGNEHGKI